MQRPIALAVIALTLVSCHDRGEGQVRETVKRSNHAQLVADAAALQRKFGSDSVVPEKAWPASFRAFEPLTVSVDQQGVFIETYSYFVASAGLFIRLDPTHLPPESGDPGFTEIAPDLYWYYAPG